jgi:1-acyl-sn-glycerol-3-phosphate acyltransferase
MKEILINSKCFCGKPLPIHKDEIIMLCECEHMLHVKCYDLTNKTICPLCKKKIKYTFKTSDYKLIPESNKPIYLQKYIDLLSMTNFDNMSFYNIKKTIKNIPSVTYILGTLPFLKGYEDGLTLVKNIFSLNNIKIKVRGLKKINKLPKIFIANHTCYLDFMVAFYVLKSGFLASTEVNLTQIGRQLVQIVPCLLIDRGVKSNTVHKMKEYVEKEGSICLFPEGMQTHPKTIINFRTGAFNVGHQVYAVVIEYDPPVADMVVKDFILKIMSEQTINIKVKILGPYLPPFSERDIENIRRDMAEAGHMFLSRVSNRDIEEVKI